MEYLLSLMYQKEIYVPVLKLYRLINHLITVSNSSIYTLLMRRKIMNFIEKYFCFTSRFSIFYNITYSDFHCVLALLQEWTSRMNDDIRLISLKFDILQSFCLYICLPIIKRQKQFFITIKSVILQ